MLTLGGGGAGGGNSAATTRPSLIVISGGGGGNYPGHNYQSGRGEGGGVGVAGRSNGRVNTQHRLN